MFARAVGAFTAAIFVAGTAGACSGGGSNSAPGASSTFCAALKKENADQISGTATQPTITKDLAQMVKTAPAFMKPSVVGISDAYGGTASAPDPSSLQASISNVVRYSQDNCGFSPDTSNRTSTPTPAG